MNYVEKFNFLGVEARQRPTISGSGAPTTETAGAVGELYMDVDNGDIYKCVSVVDEIYTWRLLEEHSANPIKGYCKGELIRIDDVSPNKHIVKCKTSVPIRVSSKNMISYPYAAQTTTSNGITFTINDDRTITANGTATADVTFQILSHRADVILPTGTYYLSGCPSGGSENTYYMQLLFYKGETYQASFSDIGSGKSLANSVLDRDNVAIRIAIKGGTTLNNLIFKPQLELGSNASSYEPPSTVSWYTPDNNNTVEFVPNSTTMTIVTDTKGVEAECEYNRDTNKVIEQLTNAIISLGGNV